MSAIDGPGGSDLTFLRPWIARPMDPANPHRHWEVACPSKAGHGEDRVVTHVSEVDAKAIAAAGQAALAKEGA